MVIIADIWVMFHFGLYVDANGLKVDLNGSCGPLNGSGPN